MPGQNSPPSSPHPRGFAEHENAKTELKALMPEDAKEAVWARVRGWRSRSGR
jgi:hypothetical protein